MRCRVLLASSIAGALISGSMAILALIATALAAAMDDAAGSCESSTLWWYLIFMCFVHVIITGAMLWTAYWDEEIETARQTRHSLLADVAAGRASDVGGTDIEAGVNATGADIAAAAAARRASGINSIAASPAARRPSRSPRASTDGGTAAILAVAAARQSLTDDREMIRSRADIGFACDVYIRSQPFCALSVVVAVAWMYSLIAISWFRGVDAIGSATHNCAAHSPPFQAIAGLHVFVGVAEPIVVLLAVAVYGMFEPRVVPRTALRALTFLYPCGASEFAFGGIISPPASDI